MTPQVLPPSDLANVSELIIFSFSDLASVSEAIIF